ncbi:MAG: formimidoylglutamate deiminase [Actinobacteria bacterium]|nr:formimidoylglutamate deiminase [Actinomycetota bacterium]
MIDWTLPDRNARVSRPEASSRSWWCEWAWLPDGVAERVRVTAGSAISAVEVGVQPEPRDVRLPGVVLPGFANVHSHAFHRALRGLGHDTGGSFWTWREQMYALAARLDPDSYLALATATYAEMALAGVTCVGEFHYLHHTPDGTPYDEPNVMAEALREASRRAGIRLTLLDACYLTGGIGEPLRAEQRRFSDGDAHRWSERVGLLRADATTRIGAAVHSVRAVPADQVEVVARESAGRPLHVHLAEQQAEVSACREAYGISPAQLLTEGGALTQRTTVVHATHVDGDDIDRIGASGASSCLCPTTERGLADGIGPARALLDAGSTLCLGSDSHAVIDLLEEARALEMDERLASGERGRLRPATLVDALTADGHRSLGWPEAGRIEARAPCDLVALRLDTVRTAGVEPAGVLSAATAADIDTVVVGGVPVVQGGGHVLGDVADLLRHSVEALTRPTS